MKLSSAAQFKRAAIQDTLRKSALFSELKAHEMEALTEVCQLKSVEKGCVLFREGETATGFYVVQTGALQVHRVTPEGKEQTIKIFRQHDSLAEIVLSDDPVFPVSAVALEHTQVVMVQRNGFRQLMQTNPSLALHMLISMCQHLRFLVQKIEDEKHKCIEARLAFWISQQPAERSASGVSSVRLGLSKKLLAAQLGVADATLSRAFSKLSQAGLIRVEDKTIHILDSARLTLWDPSQEKTGTKT